LEPLRRYTAALSPRLQAYGVATGCNRARTASAASALIDALDASDRKDVIARLAGAEIETSEAAMATAMARAQELAAVLQSPEWQVLEALRRKPSVSGAAAVSEAMQR